MNKNTIDREKYNSNITNEYNIIWLRWIFILLFLPAYILFYDRQANIGLVLITLACIFYNFINHIIISQNKYYTKWFNYNIYIDMTLITALIATDGGFSSLMYIAYSIFIVYQSVKRNIKNSLLICLFTILIYSSIGYIFFFESINVISIIFRNMLILLTGFLTMDFVNQFALYDKMHKKEYNLARKDKLTGLYNRTELEEELNKEIELCMKNKSNLCVLMYDLDNFKSFNDTHGHIAGDDLLRFFAKIILETISSSNKAFRYGGEEFLVLLKNTETKDAYKIAEVIRKKLASSNIYAKNAQGEKKRITVSGGIAGCPEHSVSYFELLELADKALYEAKSEGKNKIVISEKEI